MRTYSFGLAMAIMLMLTTSCGSDAATTATDPDPETPSETNTPETNSTSDPGQADPSQAESSWRQLPDSPLEGRMGSTVVADADQILVIGGWQAACPPTADCALPDAPPFADGARFDRTTESWAPITDAPIGFHSASAIMTDDSVWLHVPCFPTTECDDSGTLQYDIATDTWTTHPAVPVTGYFGLLEFNDSIVAYSRSDEAAPIPDYMLDQQSDEWSALPEDTLAPVYDRSAVVVDDLLYVFGSELSRTSDDDAAKLAAVYDPATDAWTKLPDSDTLGYQAWAVDNRVYLNPHFQNTGGGGVFDTDTSEWEAFPDPPDADTWNNDMAGLLGADQAVFEYDTGWVRDTTTDTWIYVEPRPDSENKSDETVAAAGTDLVVYGGQEWDNEVGGLLNELWVWTKPTSR